MTAPRLFLHVVMLIAAVGLPGCDQGGDSRDPETSATAAAEPSWSAQVADVRAGRSRRIGIAQQSVTAAQISVLATGCADLEVLDLEATEVGADDLAVISQLPRLQRIKLGGPVDDAGLVYLSQARELVAVNLPSGTFTDQGLAQLATLPKLQLLRFHSLNVTDEGLRHVAAMPALRFLHLIDVPVTDAGIVHLHSMSHLESFYLDGGECSDDGLRALLLALPELHFHRDQLHLPGDPRADAHEESSANARQAD